LNLSADCRSTSYCLSGSFEEKNEASPGSPPLG
jgi:hypothetical protein